MKITIDQIKALKPCQNRLDHFTSLYPNYSGSLEDFLSLENITYSDKVWVGVRLMTQKQKFYWAQACAESVYELFAAKRPNDNRVRKLLDFMATITDPATMTEQQHAELRQHRNAAADAAAYAADAAAAYAAAAVAAAAADAAVAAYADAAAAVAAAAADAAVAAYAVAVAAAGKITQQEFNLIILQHILTEVV